MYKRFESEEVEGRVISNYTIIQYIGIHSQMFGTNIINLDFGENIYTSIRSCTQQNEEDKDDQPLHFSKMHDKRRISSHTDCFPAQSQLVLSWQLLLSGSKAILYVLLSRIMPITQHNVSISFSHILLTVLLLRVYDMGSNINVLNSMW